MKRVKKCFTVTVVCLSMLFAGMAMPITVHAEEATQAESRMTYIFAYSNDLTISSSGVASVSGMVRGKSGVTSTYVKCTLQLNVSGSWEDVKSWEVSSSTYDATIGETYQLYAHGTYRVYMVCRANTEEKTLTSAYRTY